MFKPGLGVHFEGEEDPADVGGVDGEVGVVLERKDEPDLAFAERVGGVVDADAARAAQGGDEEMAVMLRAGWRGPVVEFVGAPANEAENVVGKNGRRGDAPAQIESGIGNAAREGFDLFQRMRNAGHG